jgi:hypothetical protein
MANPCAGRSLSIARTVRSASDSDGPALMILSVVGAAAVRRGAAAVAPDEGVTCGPGFGSLVVTS